MELPLPSDIEAERSLLASLAAPGNDNEAYLVLPSVNEADFMVPAHRAMYKALVCLVDTRTEINSITLKHALEGQQYAPGYTDMMEILMAEEVGRPHILASILRKHTLNRKIIKIGDHLMKEGFRNLEPHDVAGRATKALQELEHNRRGRISGSHILERVESGEAFAESGMGGKNIYWGMDFLTDNIESSPGHVVVIGARPKCGKSALAVQVSCASAKRGIKSLFVSLEMDNNEVESRLAANITGVGYDAFRRNTYGDSERQCLLDNAYVLDNIAVWARPSGLPISEIEVEIRDAVRRDAVTLVVVDYFQLIAHPVGKNQTEASALGANINLFKRLAQELKITVLLLVQVNREGGKSEEPSSADLKGSGDLEQSSNAIVLLWKDKHEAFHIKISDNRSGPAGFRQVVDFNGANNTFDVITNYTDPSIAPQKPQSNGTTMLAKLATKRGLYTQEEA